MTTNLLGRVAALEKNSAKPCPGVFRIICRGGTPTSAEKAQIGEAEAKGQFVVCRVIVTTAGEVATNVNQEVETVGAIRRAKN